MKSYKQEKEENQVLKKIKEALDNLEDLNISNKLKAELIFANIMSSEKQEEKSND